MSVTLERQPHGGALARGRPKGAKNKPKPARQRVQAAAARKCARAVAVLAEVMDDPDTPAPVRVAAARELLNRGVGRPALYTDALDETDGVNAAQRIEDVFGIASAAVAAEKRVAELEARIAELEGGEAAA